MTRVCLKTLGCRTNKADSIKMAQLLVSEGVELVGSELEADVVIVNSCTVTSGADRDNRRLVYKARRGENDPRVVLTGCMPMAHGTEHPWLDDRSIVITDRTEAVKWLVDRYGKSSGQPCHKQKNMSRTFVKIQEVSAVNSR